MNSEVRTRTYHVVDWKNEEIGKVMAVTKPLLLIEGEQMFKTQFSFLCPKDAKKFCRKYGRKIALLRLNSFRAIEFNKKEGMSVSDTLKGIIISEAKRKNIRWMEDIYEINLK